MQYIRGKNITDYAVNSSPYYPSKVERNYAYLAYTLSFQSTISTGRHCAILLDDEDNILHSFINISTGRCKSIHAEAGLLAEYSERFPDQDLSRCRVLVVRGSYYGKTLSKPCLPCYNCIKKHKIGIIIYSSGSDEYERILIEK